MCLVYNLVQVWNLKDADVSILHALEAPGHRSDIRTVALSSDDSLLLSGSNNEVKIWNPRYPHYPCSFICLLSFFIESVLQSMPRVAQTQDKSASCMPSASSAVLGTLHLHGQQASQLRHLRSMTLKHTFAYTIPGLFRFTSRSVDFAGNFVPVIGPLD